MYHVEEPVYTLVILLVQLHLLFPNYISPFKVMFVNSSAAPQDGRRKIGLEIQFLNDFFSLNWSQLGFLAGKPKPRMNDIASQMFPS